LKKLSSSSYLNSFKFAASTANFRQILNLNDRPAINVTTNDDETYIKILGKYQYRCYFFSFTASKSPPVTSQTTALLAIISMQEYTKTVAAGLEIILVTDGNPPYPAASVSFIFWSMTTLLLTTIKGRRSSRTLAKSLKVERAETIY
jgi:hypothetical protein